LYLFIVHSIHKAIKSIYRISVSPAINKSGQAVADDFQSDIVLY